ncbi:MAG: flap endonuclease-1 [Candidatus Methanomethylicota archaeon]|uniref:Flap endonuclease 1 n=1 Tax=Thermoproteota archaeon TaxID=2056631 RepID=A0A497ESW7_9CREN|nr:MAG: flap endonuclease-1 [Candidatus Verstraetearchaeota archaeon]
MGVGLSQLVKAKQVSLDHLAGKTVAIDALNAIYQFLAIVRLPNGSLLVSRDGKVTSHIMGLFYRTINLLEHRVKPVYVFDGKPPALKKKELEERAKVKEKFQVEWLEALREGDLVKAFKKSVMTAKVNDEILADSKTLLELMGIPYVQAPSEGEAQAAYMAAKGDVWASASQDFDSLLFGSPRLIRNLTIAGKKYYPKKGIVEELIPEVIELESVLRELGLTREQLVDLAILMGTDYNEGIYGVGPKKALKLVKSYGSAEKVLNTLGLKLDVDLHAVRNIFLNAEVTDGYSLRWREPKFDELRDFLLSLDFNSERVEKGIERLKHALRLEKQSELSKWF